RVNVAISSREGGVIGISHLGIQVEDEAEIAEVYDRMSRAERPIVETKATTCCYARSDKQWIADPQGVPWETFFTCGEAPPIGACRTPVLSRARKQTKAGPSVMPFRRSKPASSSLPACGSTPSIAWRSSAKSTRSAISASSPPGTRHRDIGCDDSTAACAEPLAGP